MSKIYWLIKIIWNNVIVLNDSKIFQMEIKMLIYNNSFLIILWNKIKIIQ
jgi:hypothetical protein